ncbi:CIR protein PIR protein [Plasmodium vinckei lentum]|uniref:CIR protein PIR protein n=1 Tax=Plasmodium vinckei lentum TaxID=138297 RepID=A0A6V7RZE5_PLAVN|nr:CIR protein PIR protein [Plasmodium vinckei lentum]
MAQSPYNIEDVYKAIYKVNKYFGEWNQGGLTIEKTEGAIHQYCHYGNTKGFGNCRNYLEKASSGVINLLKTLKDMKGLEYDKLAEYAILWLRYKLNQKTPYYDTQLNEFYTKYIQTNKHYNDKINNSGSMTYKDIIDTKKDLMNIKEMTKFSYPFNILLSLYNETNKNNLNCTKHSGKAKDFADNFEKFNKDSNNIEDSSYNKMLSTLSDDYNNLKKMYGNNKSCNFPPLPQLTPQKRPAEISGKGSERILGHTSEVTSSSSSISNTLIPALSIVPVIPVFLGIAYKYSLFGVDKLFQRQYLRKKLKKITKKMKLNI